MIYDEKSWANEETIENYIEFVPDRNFNDFRYLINSSKLEELGWKPLVTFEQGIEKTIKYFKSRS